MMTAKLPTVDFFGTPLTRLILGDNPFCGHSYIPDVVNGEAMMDYYTAENCVQTLFEAEATGINAYMALADPFILRVIRQYRNEGGRMHILFQSYPPVEWAVNLEQMMRCDPVAIYHQGGTLDYMCEEGHTDEIVKRLETIRAAGVPAGMGTHEPETVLRAEAENWGASFYMACLYNARRTQRGQQSGFITGKPKQLVFYPEDPPFMLEAIRRVSKPCIAFKLFAGGQVFIGKSEDEIPTVAEEVIRETFAGIKPGDMACVGVYQKQKNQLKENADIVRRVLTC